MYRYEQEQYPDDYHAPILGVSSDEQPISRAFGYDSTGESTAVSFIDKTINRELLEEFFFLIEMGNLAILLGKNRLFGLDDYGLGDHQSLTHRTRVVIGAHTLTLDSSELMIPVESLQLD